MRTDRKVFLQLCFFCFGVFAVNMCAEQGIIEFTIHAATSFLSG